MAEFLSSFDYFDMLTAIFGVACVVFAMLVYWLGAELLGVMVCGCGVILIGSAIVSGPGQADEARERVIPPSDVLVDPETGCRYVRYIGPLLRADGTPFCRGNSTQPGSTP